jgi:hypothetical protein
MGLISGPGPQRVRYDQTGLRGRRAGVLVDEPTGEIDWPADLLPALPPSSLSMTHRMCITRFVFVLWTIRTWWFSSPMTNSQL